MLRNPYFKHSGASGFMEEAPLPTLAIEPFAYQGKIIPSGQANEDSVTKPLKLGLIDEVISPNRFLLHLNHGERF
ncbi:MAG: hypothetical protein WBO24_17550 [Nitrospirales bacterium]